MNTIIRRLGVALIVLLVIATAVWAAYENGVAFRIAVSPTNYRTRVWGQGESALRRVTIQLAAPTANDTAAVKAGFITDHKIYITRITVWCVAVHAVATADDVLMKVLYIAPTGDAVQINAAADGDDLDAITAKTETALTLTAASRTVAANSAIYYTYDVPNYTVTLGTGYAMTIEFMEVP